MVSINICSDSGSAVIFHVKLSLDTSDQSGMKIECLLQLPHPLISVEQIHAYIEGVPKLGW